jgi:hypothetical protein
VTGAATIRRPRLLRLGLAAALACVVLPSVAAADMTPLERRVKAAFLYKFTSYVTWPAAAFPDSAAPLVIAVVGEPKLAAEVRRLTAGRAVEGRPIQVVTAERAIPERAHVAYLGGASVEHLNARDAPRPHALIVADSPGALRRGAMINFILRDGRVRFEIALHHAERAGLSLSSRLLAVAHAVRETR